MLGLALCCLLWTLPALQGASEASDSVASSEAAKLKFGVAAPNATSRGRPRHISEFTDPETGKNPFVDLTEGDPHERRRPASGTTARTPPPLAPPFPMMPVPVEGHSTSGEGRWPFRDGRRPSRFWPTSPTEVATTPEVEAESPDVGSPGWDGGPADVETPDSGDVKIPNVTATVVTSRETTTTAVDHAENSGPNPPSIVYSALLIGAAVLFFAVLTGACILKSKRKRFLPRKAAIAPANTAAQSRLLKV